MLSQLLRSVLFSTLFLATAFGQAAASSPTFSKTPKDMHGLMIYGDGFLILASEPEGWDTDTDAIALKYQSNAVFFPRNQASRSHHVNIRIRLNRKTTEEPREDMDADVSGYKKQYPAAQFSALKIDHPEYRSSAKLFFTPGDYYEYVAYLNPGAEHSLMFSITMSKEKVSATTAELAALEHILRSLRLVCTSKTKAGQR